MLSTIGRQDSSLLTKSPKPGVSTTVRRRRTPASSMSALMDWIVTVLGIMSRLGPLRSLGGYREVLNRVLTRVDLPKPDSPRSALVRSFTFQSSLHIPTTITLKLNPLRTLFRCHWLGRLAKPT